jgi:hypothetical protein
MSTALVLSDAGMRENGRWERGSVGDIPEIRNSAWRDLILKAGAILDHAPDLAEQAVAGTLALDAAYRQAEKKRDAVANPESGIIPGKTWRIRHYWAHSNCEDLRSRN